MKKILFAVSSLGLGHATRSLPIIRYYLELGYKIDIISFGNSLNYLKEELKGNNISFICLEDYPALERGAGLAFYYYLIIDLIKTSFLIRKENKFISNIGNKYEFIISDGKYGIYNKKIPSFLISHQLSFIMPDKLKFLRNFVDFFNIRYFNKFDKIFIPDFEDKDKNLAGILSHPKWINKINAKYIGILSDFCTTNKQDKEYDKVKQEKIDYLFTITGYLLEHKQSFVDKLIQEAKKLKGSKVFVLGDTSKFTKKELEGNITIYSYLKSDIKKNIFLNSNIIISRSGYTTIMDLVELEKQAILFPTPNQTEQVYLAEYMQDNNLFAVGKNTNELGNIVSNLNSINKLSFDKKTKDSLEIIDKEISKDSLEIIDKEISKFINN